MTKLMLTGGAALAMALSTGLAAAECNYNKMRTASTIPAEPQQVANLSQPVLLPQTQATGTAEPATPAPTTETVRQ